MRCSAQAAAYSSDTLRPTIGPPAAGGTRCCGNKARWRRPWDRTLRSSSSESKKFRRRNASSGYIVRIYGCEVCIYKTNICNPLKFYTFLILFISTDFKFLLIILILLECTICSLFKIRISYSGNSCCAESELISCLIAWCFNMWTHYKYLWLYVSGHL